MKLARALLLAGALSRSVYAGSPSGATHGYDYSQVPDSPSLFQRIFGLPRLAGTRGLDFSSTEWSDTIEVVEHLRGNLQKIQDQMAFKRPQAWKMMEAACRGETDVTFRKEVVAWVRAKYPPEVAEILILGKLKKTEDCRGMSAAALKAAHRYIDARGACRVSPKPMRATAFYLLDSLKDEPALKFPPGMDPASFFALTRTLIGEAQSLSCNSSESYQQAVLAEIQGSLRRKKAAGAQFSAAQQEMLSAKPVVTNAGSRGSLPWWAEPCRKGNMEVIAKAVLNRSVLKGQEEARENAARWVGQVSDAARMRGPASSSLSKATPPVLKEIIRRAAFSEWNEFDNPRAQGLACLITGGGNYGNFNTTGSALFAIRNVLGKDQKGRSFLRGSVPISDKFTSFAKKEYINQLDGDAARSSITLYEGPPPGNPNLGRVKFDGAIYGDRQQGRFPDQAGHVHMSLTEGR